MSDVIPQTPSDYDTTRVFERPNGFYWVKRESGEEFGPFASLLDAINDMQYNAESELEVGETVREAEDEIGVAEWIDPETGLPAEDSVPRIKDN